MRLCTTMQVIRSHRHPDGWLVVDEARLIDVSLVCDSHPAGFDPAGLLHIQAPPVPCPGRGCGRDCGWPR